MKSKDFEIEELFGQGEELRELVNRIKGKTPDYSFEKIIGKFIAISLSLLTGRSFICK